MFVGPYHRLVKPGLWLVQQQRYPVLLTGALLGHSGGCQGRGKLCSSLQPLRVVMPGCCSCTWVSFCTAQTLRTSRSPCASRPPVVKD